MYLKKIDKMGRKKRSVT